MSLGVKPGWFYDNSPPVIHAQQFVHHNSPLTNKWRKNVPTYTAGFLSSKTSARTKTTFAESDIEVISKLGSGNFGDVFKVRIKSDGRLVAMKTLRENVSRDTKDAFVKEMEMMAAMCHDNVVRCIGTVKSEGEMKILLELVNQGSLDKLLPKRLFTDRGKSRLMLDIARGVEYLHRHNIMH
uniref:Protein kinase domain-containing protein n=1 Tax=Romanomermis culicivorax TaxID=13658 RepID=A0A915KY00_ROMCU